MVINENMLELFTEACRANHDVGNKSNRLTGERQRAEHYDATTRAAKAEKALYAAIEKLEADCTYWQKMATDWGAIGAARAQTIEKLETERDIERKHREDLQGQLPALEARIRELEKTRPRIVVRTWEAHSGPYGCFYDMGESSPNGKPWSYWSDRNNKPVHPDVIEHVLNSALEVLEMVRERLEVKEDEPQQQ